MSKNAYFLKKSCKFAATSSPQALISLPSDPALLLPSTDYLTSAFLALNVFYYFEK